MEVQQRSSERRALLAEALKDEAWRLSIASYASTASHWRKRWKPYRWLRHLSQVVQEHLRRGGARLIVNAPPRHGKSELISHWLPVWHLDWYPDRRIIAACYGDSLASDWGRAVRDEFLMNEATWTRVRQDTQAVNDWKTTEGGGMRTAGVGGPLTGKGGDLIILDDPHKNWEDAMSPISRQRLIDWFNAVLYTRLEPDASIIVVQTRWHERDMTGYLLNDHSDSWTRIILPALAEKDDPLGRSEGEALCPERFTAERLLEIKNAVGLQMFAGIFQQRPTPPEGSIVKHAHLRYYDELPEDLESFLLSFDLTFEADGSSFVVGQAWAKKGANYYILDQVRAKPDFSGQLAMVRQLKKAWPQATVILVERKANGAALISTLKDEIPGIVPIVPTSSKEARLMAVQPLFEAGNVWCPAKGRAAWVSEWVDELTTFPYSENDDQVDATTQALLRYRRLAAGQADTQDLDLGIDSGTRTSEWRF